MVTLRLSATAARNRFFDLLNQVALGRLVIIERDNKEIAILGPKKISISWRGLLKTSQKVHGILRDENFDLTDNPLRRPGAKNFLGRWGKDFKIKNT